MTRHILNINEIKGFTSEIELAGSYGKGENKSLKAVIVFDSKKIEFKVYDGGSVVGTEQDLNKAIDIYNKI